MKGKEGDGKQQPQAKKKKQIKQKRKENKIKKRKISKKLLDLGVLIEDAIYCPVGNRHLYLL